MQYEVLGKATHYTYLLAGVHGDEPEGVYVLAKLRSWLKSQAINKPYVIVPALNEYGLANNCRTNSSGVDLNRNWPTKDWSPDAIASRYNPGPSPLSEAENILLAKLFEQYPPAFILSLHSLKRLLDYNPRAKAAAEYISSFNNYPTQAGIGYPTPGSLGTYATEELDCPILTLELPEAPATGISYEQIWQENNQALTEFCLNFEVN